MENIKQLIESSKSAEEIITSLSEKGNYMDVGHKVKVTYTTDKDLNKNGIIMKNSGEFVEVKLDNGKTRRFNVSMLFDKDL